MDTDELVEAEMTSEREGGSQEHVAGGSLGLWRRLTVRECSWMVGA